MSSRKRKTARVRREAGERLRAYSTEYPKDGKGHDYSLKDVPGDIWTTASERAQVEQRSLRWVLITLLGKYGRGEVALL